MDNMTVKNNAFSINSITFFLSFTFYWFVIMHINEQTINMKTYRRVQKKGDW